MEIYVPKEIVNIITVYKDIYKQKAVLAGGAVRDQLLGKKVSDYDVFMEVRSFNKERDISELRILLAYEGATNFEVTTDESGGTEYPFTLVEATLRGGEKVQFILLEATTADEWINTFSVNISKVSWECGEIKKHPDFEEGVKNKKLVFSENTSAAYIKKITEKYSDYDSNI